LIFDGQKIPQMKSGMILLLVGCTSTSVAQPTRDSLRSRAADSLRHVYLDKVAMLIPQQRQGAISVEAVGNGTVRIQLHGQDFLDGKENSTRANANVSLPLPIWGKNNFSLNLAYMQQRMQLKGLAGPGSWVDPQHTVFRFDQQTYSLGIVYLRSDTVGHMPLVLYANVTAVADANGSSKKIDGLAAVIFPIKRTTVMALSLGLVFSDNPSAPSTVLPFIRYWQKLGGGPELLVDIPSRIMLRVPLSSRSWLNVGSDLTGTLSFVTFGQPDMLSFPRHDLYTTVETRSGAWFEVLLTRKLILGFSGGWLSTLDSRVFELTKRPQDNFLSSKYQTVPYVNCSLSILPFLYGKKSRRGY
jgi:hypothetical protein